MAIRVVIRLLLIIYSTTMADPVLGRDAIIQFYKGGAYYNYGCASEVEIQFSMETKSVKTVGDGIWKRSRGQSVGYKIELSGVITQDNTIPVAFDLLDYFKNMTDIQFRMLFYDETGLIKIITGNALPTNVNLGGSSEGHATGSITLEGSGEPDQIVTPPNPNPPGNPGNPQNPVPNCDGEIVTAHIAAIFPNPGKYVFVDSMTAGSPTISRFDYMIDSSGVFTAFTDGSIPTHWKLPSAYTSGSHTITITPICDNGFSGTPFTFTFS